MRRFSNGCHWTGSLISLGIKIGFTPGSAIFTVTDSALCSVIGSTYLQADAGFSVLSIATQNSTCSVSGGTITINVVGNGPFKYTLIKPDSSTESFTTTSTSQNYNDLDALRKLKKLSVNFKKVIIFFFCSIINTKCIRFNG